MAYQILRYRVIRLTQNTIITSKTSNVFEHFFSLDFKLLKTTFFEKIIIFITFTIILYRYYF